MKVRIVQRFYLSILIRKIICDIYVMQRFFYCTHQRYKTNSTIDNTNMYDGGPHVCAEV